MIVASLAKNANGLISMLPSLVAGKPDAHHEPVRAQQVEAEPESGHLRGEDEAGVDATDLAANHVERFVGTERHRCAERLHEIETLRTDVDADDLVAKRGRDLHGVVAESAGGADDRDRSARAVTWCASIFFTAPYAVRPPQASGASLSPRLSGIFTKRRRPHREVLGEGAHERLGLHAAAAAGR